MRILFISHQFYPFIGGIEVNSEILAFAFFNAGVEVRVMTWTKEIGEKTFPFQVIRNPNLLILLQQYKWADVVFENNLSLRLSWPSIFYNKPSVIALRTWVSRVNGRLGWQDILKNIWLRRSTSVIAVSEAVRKKCWSKALVIGNPYRTELFRILPNSIRSKDFVFLGRLVSDKGADIAIKSFSKLFFSENCKKKDQQLTMTIIGDGPERKLLQNLVNDLKLSEVVFFTGALKGEELVNQLNQHKFLLVPSSWEEPFGNVALEGMACGCIPIVSDGGGLPDAVGNAGLIFKRNDVYDLKRCMQLLTSDQNLKVQLQHAAISHLEKHHPAIVSMKYLDVIKNAVRSIA